jgi:hypothetical protein
VVGVTLGPLGRSVVIEDHKEQPRITKDGVTVVKHLEYVFTIVCRKIGSKTQFALLLNVQWQPRINLPVMAPPPRPFSSRSSSNKDEKCYNVVRMPANCD